MRMILLCSGQKAMVVEGDPKKVETFKDSLKGKGREMDIRQAVHILYLMNDKDSFEKARESWTEEYAK